MEELSIQAGPSSGAFYILIISHNESGRNQAQAGAWEAINSDSGRRRGGVKFFSCTRTLLSHVTILESITLFKTAVLIKKTLIYSL